MVIKLYVYIDILFLTNFVINMFLLLLTAYVTKKRLYPLKVIAGAFVGSLSVIMLFLNLNDLSAFFFKFVFAVLMVIFSFKSTLKGYIKTTAVFYLLSFCLSGIIYHFNTSFGEKTTLDYLTISLSGICFITFIVICVNSIKQRISDKKFFKTVIITHNSIDISLTGFMDSGNNLTEPISGLPVIIADTNEIKPLGNVSTIPIMCHTISGNGIINVFKPEKITVDGEETKAFIGISDKLKNDNFSVLLNNNLRRYNNAS